MTTENTASLEERLERAEAELAEIKQVMHDLQRRTRSSLDAAIDATGAKWGLCFTDTGWMQCAVLGRSSYGPALILAELSADDPDSVDIDAPSVVVSLEALALGLIDAIQRREQQAGA